MMPLLLSNDWNLGVSIPGGRACFGSVYRFLKRVPPEGVFGQFPDAYTPTELGELLIL